MNRRQRKEMNSLFGLERNALDFLKILIRGRDNLLQSDMERRLTVSAAWSLAKLHRDRAHEGVDEVFEDET